MALTRPPSGSMVHWRMTGKGEWLFGYVTYVKSYNMIRLGRWNGDTSGGPIVDIADIEWTHR